MWGEALEIFMKRLRNMFDKVNEAALALSVWSHCQISTLSRVHVKGGYAFGQRAKGKAVTPDRETPIYERDT